MAMDTVGSDRGSRTVGSVGSLKWGFETWVLGQGPSLGKLTVSDFMLCELRRARVQGVLGFGF